MLCILRLRFQISQDSFGPQFGKLMTIIILELSLELTICRIRITFSFLKTRDSWYFRGLYRDKYSLLRDIISGKAGGEEFIKFKPSTYRG